MIKKTLVFQFGKLKLPVAYIGDDEHIFSSSELDDFIKNGTYSLGRIQLTLKDEDFSIPIVCQSGYPVYQNIPQEDADLPSLIFEYLNHQHFIWRNPCFALSDADVIVCRRHSDIIEAFLPEMLEIRERDEDYEQEDLQESEEEEEASDSNVEEQGGMPEQSSSLPIEEDKVSNPVSSENVQYPILLTDATEESVLENLKSIKADPTNTYFTPRVELYDEYIISNLTPDILQNIYALAENNKLDECTNPVYVQCIRDIKNYFDGHIKSSFSLKALFDLFSIEDMDLILHIYVRDKSPNGLYENVFFLLYLTYYMYKIQNPNASEEEVTTILYIKLPEISLRIEQAVFLENSSKNEDEDDINLSTEMIVVQSLLDISKGFILGLINHTIVNYPIVINDQLLQGIDRIRYFCLTGLIEQNPFILDNDFLRTSGIGPIRFCLKEDTIEFATLDGQLISMYALGHMLSVHSDNIKHYIEENFQVTNADFLDTIEDSIKFNGVNYNTSLQYIKNNEVFRSVIDVNKYSALLTSDNLQLTPDKIVMGLYNGKPLPRPLGIIFYNKKAEDPSKGFIFLPAVGTYLKSLADNGVNFEDVDLKISKMTQYGEDDIYAIINIAEVKAFLDKERPASGSIVVLKQPPYTRDNLENFNVSDTLFRIATATGYGTVSVPNCVLSDASALVEAYAYYFKKYL